MSRCICVKKRKNSRTQYVLCAKTNPPVAAVITMRIFVCELCLSTEVVLAETQNYQKHKENSKKSIKEVVQE